MTYIIILITICIAAFVLSKNKEFTQKLKEDLFDIKIEFVSLYNIATNKDVPNIALVRIYDRVEQQELMALWNVRLNRYYIEDGFTENGRFYEEDEFKLRYEFRKRLTA